MLRKGCLKLEHLLRGVTHCLQDTLELALALVLGFVAAHGFHHSRRPADQHQCVIAGRRQVLFEDLLINTANLRIQNPSLTAMSTHGGNMHVDRVTAEGSVLEGGLPNPGRTHLLAFPPACGSYGTVNTEVAKPQ